MRVEKASNWFPKAWEKLREEEWGGGGVGGVAKKRPFANHCWWLSVLSGHVLYGEGNVEWDSNPLEMSEIVQYGLHSSLPPPPPQPLYHHFGFDGISPPCPQRTETEGISLLSQ